jgi:hypothetical protein
LDASGERVVCVCVWLEPFSSLSVPSAAPHLNLKSLSLPAFCPSARSTSCVGLWDALIECHSWVSRCRQCSRMHALMIVAGRSAETRFSHICRAPGEARQSFPLAGVTDKVALVLCYVSVCICVSCRCSICPFMIYGEVMQRWRTAQSVVLRKWPKEESE